MTGTMRGGTEPRFGRIHPVQRKATAESFGEVLGWTWPLRCDLRNVGTCFRRIRTQTLVFGVSGEHERRIGPRNNGIPALGSSRRS